MKTAEEILISKRSFAKDFNHFSESQIIQMMNEYAFQFMTFKECYECNGAVGNDECQMCKGVGKYILLPMITTTGT